MTAQTGTAFARPFTFPDALTQVESRADATQSIQDCLRRFRRGMDRKDDRMLRGCCWPEAAEAAEMSGLAPMVRALPMLAEVRRSAQTLGNVLVTVERESARVESWVVAYLWVPLAGAEREIVVGGRYVDRFERREGEWRIAARRFHLDWHRVCPDGGCVGLEPATPEFSR